MPFGVEINEDVVFKCLLGLMLILSLLLMFIIFVILWLCKIQRQVNKAVEAVNTGNQILLRMPQISPSSYMDFAVNESELDEASVDGYTTQREPVKGSDTLALASGSGPSESLNSFLRTPGDSAENVTNRKIYKSLKCQTEASYAKLYQAALEVDVKNNIPRGDEKEIAGDQEVSVAMDTAQSDYENEYLVVIASDTPSGISPSSAEISTSRKEDNTEYLAPIDAVPKAKSLQSQADGESHSASKSKAVGASEREKDMQATPNEKGGAQLDYDYVNPRVLNELKGSPGGTSSAQEPQRANKDTEDKKKLSCDENENGYLILINGIESENQRKDADNGANFSRATKEHAQSRQSVTDEVYESVSEGDNRGRLEATTSVKPETIYRNQSRDLKATPNVQNSDGATYSDEGSFYANSNEVQRKSTDCKDNPAFDDSDECPIYANEQISRNKNVQ